MTAQLKILPSITLSSTEWSKVKIRFSTRSVIVQCREDIDIQISLSDPSSGLYWTIKAGQPFEIVGIKYNVRILYVKAVSGSPTLEIIALSL